MAKINIFFENIWYWVRCWFVRNPNNPQAPRLWDIKPETKIEVHRKGKLSDTFVINRVFWKIGYGGELNCMAKVQGIEKEIYLSDQGVIPYNGGVWNEIRVPYLVD